MRKEACEALWRVLARFGWGFLWVRVRTEFIKEVFYSKNYFLARKLDMVIFTKFWELFRGKNPCNFRRIQGSESPFHLGEKRFSYGDSIDKSSK